MVNKLMHRLINSPRKDVTRQNSLQSRLLHKLALISTILLSTMTSVSHASDTPAGIREECLHCHSDIWEESQNKRFIHQPFQSKLCGDCHISPPSPGAMLGQDRQRRQEREQVKWIARKFVLAPTHWLRIPAYKVTGDLLIEASAGRGKLVRQQLPLSPLDDLPLYHNDHTPPQVSNVKVLEINKGVFYSATIAWETDEAANSIVQYGIGGLNLSSNNQEDHFATNHQITLFNIDPQKKYLFRVSSEDLLGNQANSEVLTFSASEDFSPTKEQYVKRRRNFRSIEIDTDFFQSEEGGYIVKVTANQPVKLRVGTAPAHLKKASLGNLADGKEPQEVKHVSTINKFYINISTCLGCHEQYVDGMSHPVNVYPKGGMKIPPEYPTLEDGRMTCMSCHAVHASNLKHRVIKESAKELCEGCHKGMNSGPEVTRLARYIPQ